MISIRPASAADLREIAAVNIACAPNGKHASMGVEATARYFSFFLQEGGPFLVAADGERVVGYVMGHYRGSTAREDFVRTSGRDFIPDEAYLKRKAIEEQYDCVLLSLSVLPAYQGNGISKRLVAAFLNHLRQGGRAHSCYVGTQADNHVAQHVYESCGYMEIFRDENSVKYAVMFDA